MTYQRKMGKIYEKIKVFHGTSFPNAVKIASTGFRVSNDWAGKGVFVKDNLDMSVLYAREHDDNGAVVKAELYLKHGEYSIRGHTIIVTDPLLLVPTKIFKLERRSVDSEENPMPVRLSRQR